MQLFFFATFLAKKRGEKPRKFIFTGIAVFVLSLLIFLAGYYAFRSYKVLTGNVYAIPSYGINSTEKLYKIPGKYMEYQIAETLKNPQPVWFSAFYPSMKPFRSGSKEPLVRIYLYGVDNESLFRKKLYDVIAADFQEKQDRDGFFEYKSNLEWIPDYYLVPKLKNENIYGMQCYERTCSLYAKSNRNVVFKASTEANLIINDWENIYNFAQKLIEEFEIKSDR